MDVRYLICKTRVSIKHMASFLYRFEGIKKMDCISKIVLASDISGGYLVR